MLRKILAPLALASVASFSLAQSAAACDAPTHEYACCAVPAASSGPATKKIGGGCAIDRASAVTTCNTLATAGGFQNTKVEYNKSQCPAAFAPSK